MRLALIISNLAVGGAQRIMSILVNAWAQQGWQITLVTLDDGVEPPFYELHPAVMHRPLGLSGTSSTSMHGVFNNLKRLWILRQAIKRSSPHAVLSFMDKPNILTILATLRLGLPVVISERTDPAHHPIGKAWDRLRGWVYPHCTRLVVQSPAALSYFSAKLQQRARVIPNPVLLPGGSETLPKRASNTGAKTILAMGRLCTEKRFDLLLGAFAQVAATHPDWSLVIWGEGPLRIQLERLRQGLSLKGRVFLPGLTTQPFVEMRQADLFVLSSRYEGFPNALCEAMACGLPVISFDCPSGPREIITDGVDGVLVRAGDVDALASAMDRLMISAAERQRLAVCAPGVTKRFALQKVLKMWGEVLAEAIQARHAGRVGEVTSTGAVLEKNL